MRDLVYCSKNVRLTTLEFVNPEMSETRKFSGPGRELTLTVTKVEDWTSPALVQVFFNSFFFWPFSPLLLTLNLNWLIHQYISSFTKSLMKLQEERSYLQKFKPDINMFLYLPCPLLQSFRHPNVRFETVIMLQIYYHFQWVNVACCIVLRESIYHQ